MNARLFTRNILMILAGVAGLLAKSWFAGSIGELGHSYLGNVAVSFAVYFWVSLAAGARLSRVAVSVIALIIVELFELADGFGIMANVYDPWDYLANALGMVLAIVVDVVSARVIAAGSGRP
jgi:hypothetical protein